MKRFCFILSLLVLIVGCTSEKKERDDLFDAKIHVIKENHEKLAEATTVGDVVKILEAVNVGCQSEDAKNEMQLALNSNLDTASIRISGEKLVKVSDIFIQRATKQLQEMSPTTEETLQLLGLIKSIRVSNNSYKSYLPDSNVEGKTQKKEESRNSVTGSMNLYQSDDVSSSDDSESRFFTDDNGDFDLGITLETVVKFVKVIDLVQELF